MLCTVHNSVSYTVIRLAEQLVYRHKYVGECTVLQCPPETGVLQRDYNLMGPLSSMGAVAEMLRSTGQYLDFYHIK